jgi:SAM-dependent methyltransferase
VLLTISTTHQPASDLGYLLHKHPDKVQEFSQTFGKARVFYPECSDDRCTVALQIEVDPVEMVRGASAGSLDQYVNPRPYAASSLLAVAMGTTFRTAMSGCCDAKPELAAQVLPLEAVIYAMPCRQAGKLVREHFEPLGYEVTIADVEPDPMFPQWLPQLHRRVTLRGTVRLADLLSHLYILLPILGADKHYHVGEAEIDKLDRFGESWIPLHPLWSSIVRRYLTNQTGLTRPVLHKYWAIRKEWRLRSREAAQVAGQVAGQVTAEDVTDTLTFVTAEDDTLEIPEDDTLGLALAEDAVLDQIVADAQAPAADAPAADDPGTQDEVAQDPDGPDDQTPEAKQDLEDAGLAAGAPRLNDVRMQAVKDALLASGAASVVDLGCGEGRFLGLLKDESQFKRIVGIDVSPWSLERASHRLRMRKMNDAERERLQLWGGSVVYRDERLARAPDSSGGFDAAVAIEVIEHLDPHWLPHFAQNLLGIIQPQIAVVTTPNAEYNSVWEGMSGKMRHWDHKFEWTRAEFEAWTREQAAKFGYEVTFSGLGPTDEARGTPTQMAVFRRGT